MSLTARWPLGVGILVVLTLYKVISLFCSSLCAVGVLTVLFLAGIGVALHIGSRYHNEHWKERRAQLRLRTTAKSDEKVTEGKPLVKYTVVAPCFNEEERIGKMIEETADYFKKSKDTWELIIVDDGSKDNSINQSLKVAASLGIEDFVKVVPVSPNRGKGYAVKQGVFASNGELVLMADADAATDINDLPQLASRISPSVQIVCGSRAHMEESSKAERSIPRSCLMHIFHFCVSFTFCFIHKPTIVRDTQCGFKLFTRDAALRAFSNIRLERWAFDVELLVVASLLGMGVAEVQVHWQEIDGSKMTVKGMVRMGMELLLTCVCMRFGNWTVRSVQAD